MEHTLMKNSFKKAVKIGAVITATLSASILFGCAGVGETELRDNLPYSDVLTNMQALWLIFLESFIILFLISIIILLLFLFRRYKKIEKRTMETSIRERALMNENEMLNRMGQMKTEFLQNMSHDFKTPLAIISTSVLNAMDIIESDYDKEELLESLILAQSETLRMSRILDNAILLSDKKKSEPVNVVRFLRKVEKIFKIYLVKNKNTLKTDAPKTLPLIYYDSDTLLNIISNLISNANRYTRNGEIIISAEETPENPDNINDRKFITITVSDSGMGVDPTILPDVFKRGTSKAKTKTRTGLGLSICKEAVESYGGTIDIESEYGKGTKIIFTVPVFDENEADSERRTGEK